MPPIEEEIVSFKCVHWDIFEWSKLDHRVLGPVFEAGGHDWYYKNRQEKQNKTDIHIGTFLCSPEEIIKINMFPSILT